MLNVLVRFAPATVTLNGPGTAFLSMKNIVLNTTPFVFTTFPALS